MVGASYKRRDMLIETQAKKVQETLQTCELKSWKGLNQELDLKRPNDTRWVSFYKSLLNLNVMFSSIINVLDNIVVDDSNSKDG